MLALRLSSFACTARSPPHFLCTSTPWPPATQEDIILPQHYTFYELIKTQARGKSGPLFDFSVREDVRVVNDASKEKTDSHAGKIVERHWYDRNKHIFPANRWEVRGAGRQVCESWTARKVLHSLGTLSKQQLRYQWLVARDGMRHVRCSSHLSWQQLGITKICLLCCS